MPKPDPYNASLKPDPCAKGSYYRRIEDIGRALKKLGVEQLPDGIKFLALYFGCEKLARGIVGIPHQYRVTDAYHHHHYLCLAEVDEAAIVLSLSISSDDLCCLFADHRDLSKFRALNPPCSKSARLWRNEIGHNFGPTTVQNVETYARFFIPKMTSFLDCAKKVTAYQKANFSGIV
jgi:hypothetical protein